MKRFIIIFVCLCMLVSLCSCTMKSDKKISEKKIEEQKTEFENYLKKTYPDESFTVELWQEYGKETGAAGLPDYEGYLLRQVCTDSKGNRFKVFVVKKGEYSDDYRDVLNGKIHYNEKGQREFYKENGELWYVTD